MKTILGVFVVLTILALVVVPASASVTQCDAGAAVGTFVSSLDFGNSALSGFSQPFGTVCVSLTNSTTANVTFTAENSYLFVDGAAAGIQVNATHFGESALSESLLGVTQSFGTFDLSNGNVDGLGTFNLQIDNGNSSNRADTIMFTVTNGSGTWADAGAVLTFNGVNGYDAEAHIGAGISPFPSGTMTTTGYAGEDSGGGGHITGVVPEPGMLIVSLLGLGLTVAINQRRGKRAA